MPQKNPLARLKKKKALAFIEERNLPAAAAALERVCKLDPRDGEAWNLLGAVNGMLGKPAIAVDCLRRAVALQPKDAKSRYNLALALRDSGDLAAAVTEFRATLRLQPDYPTAHYCLAQALISLWRLEEAADTFRDALQLQPANADTHSNLGAVYQAQGYLEQAVTCCREALRLKPEQPAAYDNLGNALTAQGKFDEAIACYREGLRLRPEDHSMHSNLLLALNYPNHSDPAELLAEHRAWAAAHGPASVASMPPNSREPERRLKIGYVSPDFREHSVAYFIEPLLLMHDRDQVEVFCYSDVPRADPTMTRLQGLADVWRDIRALDDVQTERLVRADGIDLLIDLAGHTAGDRLRLFARKPAPLQVTYLGYPNTTGLDAIDYRLTDARADPPSSDAYYTETLVRLPGCFLCYQPPTDAPDVGPLPAQASGHITFGSFNNLAKISPAVIALWAQVIDAVPDSRLLVKNPSLTDPETREHYYALFAEAGAGRDRVELIGHTPTRAEHLAMYGRMDVALDTFPYNGTTTTCEALWMGVPVISLAGAHHAGRVGLSLLHTADHGDWVAHSENEFIAIARQLTAGPDRLAALRASLRLQLQESALCDSSAFACKVDAAYRELWRTWCKQNLGVEDEIKTT